MPHPLQMVRHIQEVEVIAEALYESAYELASITRWSALPSSTRAAYVDQAHVFLKLLENRA